MDRDNTKSNNSALVVTLTVGQLRELVRSEIRTVLANSGSDSTHNAGVPQHAITANTPYLSVKEAAELARVGPSTIRLYIRKGQLKHQKLGRRVIVSRAELERFLTEGSSNEVKLYPG